MNSRSTMFTTTKSNTSKKQTAAIIPQQLSQYIICSMVGMLAGVTSVALVIGLIVVIQLQLPLTMSFSAQGMVLIGASLLASVGCSWLFDRLMHLVLPKRLYRAGPQGLQIIFTFGVLTSLLEALLFRQGL